ncbi:MAG TPA: DinB family protein [Herpetosiphonaceae bacterium]
MLAELQQQCTDLDRRSRTLLDELAHLAPPELSFKPHPRSWSILEVVQHLVLAEQDVIGNARFADTPAFRRRDLRALLGYPAVFLVLYYGVPWPVPSAGMIPDGRATLAELRSQWSDLHAWLQHYVDRLTPTTIKRAVFYHPLTGPITVKQTLVLSHIHLTCHTRQIERIKQLALASATSAAYGSSRHP